MNNNKHIYCPVCNTDCKKIIKDDIELDECTICKAVWFDPGELSATFEEKINDINDRKLTELICPVCFERLYAYEKVAGKLKIRIHGCEKCRGFWIDRKNIDLMENRSNIASAKRIYSDKADIKMLFPGIEIEEKKYHPALYLFSLVFGVPIEIYKPVRRFPKGLFLIVLLNFLVFLFLPKGLFKVFGLISSEAFNPLRAYSYITYSFFHVGWLHIILNMYLFWIFGDNLYSLFYEKYSGEKGIKRFVLFSIICTAFSGLTHVILMRSFGDASLLNIPLVGASGLVSAYIAAYYRKFPDAKMYQVVLFYPFKVSVKIYLVFYLGLNLIMAYRYGVYSNISWQCHVGGLVAGYFFVDYFLKDKVEFNS